MHRYQRKLYFKGGIDSINQVSALFGHYIEHAVLLWVLDFPLLIKTQQCVLVALVGG